MPPHPALSPDGGEGSKERNPQMEESDQTRESLSPLGRGPLFELKGEALRRGLSKLGENERPRG
jgi:hypothetical protein